MLSKKAFKANPEIRMPSVSFFDEALKNLEGPNHQDSMMNIEELKTALDTKKGDRFVRVVRVAWLIWRYMRLLKINRKRQKHRKYVIEELVKTEHQYLESLQLIVEKLLKESNQAKLLNKEESDKIFSNIESIFLFHKEFYSNLKKSFENFTKTTKVANGIFKMLPFFKLYYLYCNNFHHSSEEVESMKNNQHPFTERIKKMEFTEEMQNLDLSSLLIKPVQRLPKYVLLFKDLIKNTEQTHPDYHDISECLKRFQEINVENNSKMNFHLKKRKVIELDNKFGKEIKKELNIEIVDPQREFLEEEALHIILDNMPKPVICYFFCDLILVTETIKGESLIKFLSLDHNSYVRDLANQKYFKWIFSVYGKDGGLTFSTDSKENKKKMMKFIEKQILQVLREKADMKTNLKKQMGQEIIQSMEVQNDPKKIQVHVLGTMKRGMQHYSRTYTVYVIEITYELNNEKVSTKIYFRYSELSKLNSLIKQEFPTFNINHLPPKYWFSSQKTKTIESRKLLIENFLQSVLSKEDLIKKSKNKILNFLGLAEYFNYKPSIPERNSQQFFSVTEMPEKEISEKFGRMSVFSAIAESHKTNLRPSRLSKYMNAETTELVVRLMNGRHLKLLINKFTKASEICEEIAADINLQSSLDFKLFLFHNKDDIRVLHDDEYMLKALDLENWENIEKEEQPKAKEERKSEGFFATFKKSIESKFSKLKNNIKGKSAVPDVIYKKYLYLPSSFEENDLKLDPVKLELISAQIFEDIHNFKYILNLEEYSLIASLQAYIEYGRYEDNQEDIFLMDKITSHFLPPSIITRKGEKFWHDNISNKWKKLSIEINQICQKSVKSSFCPDKSGGKSNLNDHKLVARLIAINSMKKHFLYGAALYWVNFHKKSDTPESSLPIPDNLWLAIKFTSLSLLYPDDKREFMEFSYYQITKFSSYPTSIEITTEKNVYRFNTPHSFEIYQLIDEYEKLHKLLPEMKNKKTPSILRKNSYDSLNV